MSERAAAVSTDAGAINPIGFQNITHQNIQNIDKYVHLSARSEVGGSETTREIVSFRVVPAHAWL